MHNKYNIQYKINSNIYDCEHRYFHLNAIRQNNVKLFIYNKNLFPKFFARSYLVYYIKLFGFNFWIFFNYYIISFIY